MEIGIGGGGQKILSLPSGKEGNHWIKKRKCIVPWTSFKFRKKGILRGLKKDTLTVCDWKIVTREEKRRKYYRASRTPLQAKRERELLKKRD